MESHRGSIGSMALQVCGMLWNGAWWNTVEWISDVWNIFGMVWGVVECEEDTSEKGMLFYVEYVYGRGRMWNRKP